jgi:phenylacetate-CoA ligase
MVHAVKHVRGILHFQIIQNELDSIQVKVVTNQDFKTGKDDLQFMEGLRTRLGRQMNISVEYVEKIPRENNGKFRLIKNYCLEKK